MKSRFSILVLISAVLMIADCSCGQQVSDAPRIEVQRGPVNFSLGAIPGLKSYAPDSISWNQYVSSNEMSGPMIYFMKPGLDISMSSPHIRMDYVSKTAPNSATVSEIFTWFINWYNSEGRTSEVINDKEVITTSDGQEVRVLEILKHEHINTSMGDGKTVSAKKIAYAYIDNGDSFWIGACLTVSGDLKDYDQMMVYFRQVIASFKAGSKK